MPPKKSNELNFKKKRELIEDYKSGNETQRGLAEKYKISIGAVNTIVENSDKYLKQTLDRNEKCKRVRKSNNEKLNELVVKFIATSNAIQSPIAGPEIKSFASEVSTRLGLDHFKASNGWLQSLNRRFNFSYKTFSGEASDVSESSVNEWKAKLPELTIGYEPKDIFNFDETAIFYKLLPKKSSVKKGLKAIGRKKLEQRITVGLCCSATGEKLKPLVIGSAQKPRCFANIKYKINSLGIDYFNNTNAWMTQNVFDEWIKKLI